LAACLYEMSEGAA